jgi:ribosomal protein L32
MVFIITRVGLENYGDATLSKWFVSKQEAQTRYAMCKSCEHFIISTRICNICCCFMPWKVTQARLRCPIGLWDRGQEYQEHAAKLEE